MSEYWSYEEHTKDIERSDDKEQIATLTAELNASREVQQQQAVELEQARAELSDANEQLDNITADLMAKANVELGKIEQERDTALARLQEMSEAYADADARAQHAAEALRRVLAGFDAGVFVRNTNGDDDPSWAIKLLPHLNALAGAQELLAATSGQPEGDSGRRAAAEWREDARHIHKTVAKQWPVYGPEDQRFLALAMAGEVGELLNVIKKVWRGDLALDDAMPMIREELCDIDIYHFLLADSFGVDRDEACAEKIPELYRRWPEALEGKPIKDNAATSGQPEGGRA